VKRRDVKAAAFALLLLLVWNSGCDSTRRLDEFVFHKGPKYTLKAVRYYRNIFLHYNGEVFSIQCRSAGTERFRAGERQDKGWNNILTGGAIGTESAKDVVAVWQEYFLFLDDDTLAVTHSGLSVTFDACATFQGWYATQVPIEMVDQIEKPSHCAPQGTGDCRHYDFQGDRAAKIEELRISPDGAINFLARTPAFKAGILRIESADKGQTWTAEPVHARPVSATQKTYPTPARS
jgi:hypothetical protein